MNNKVFWIASLIAVVIIYHVTYGLATLIPTNVSWLMTVLDDWGTHYLGWFFYRNEPWHFPLGHVSGYYYPVGTNVGFTDSIPLMAIFFKIFSPLLPADFQYFGIWLLLCDLLAAYFTIRLFRLFKVNTLCTFAAVVFVVANPVLVYRGMHPALCAQWLLIASIYLYFLNTSIVRVNKILLYQFILLMIAVLVNPYLGFMVFGFTVTTACRICFFDKAISKKRFVGYLGGTMFSILLSWYIVGMVSFGKKENLDVQGAYGLYSMNLNSLYNPGALSSFLPAIKKVGWEQFESFMYLGAGIIGLILILLLYALYGVVQKRALKKKQEERGQAEKVQPTNLVPLIVFTILVALFAITNVISINDKVVLKIPIPSFLIKLGEIFRASARFFWIPYYLLFLFSIIAVAKLKINPLLRSSVIVIALFIQLYDTIPVLTFKRHNITYGSYDPPLDNKSWTELMEQFDDIAFYPPFESHQRTNMDYQYFCFLAARLRKSINIGYVARSDGRSMNLYSDSLSTALQGGRMSPKTLYISTMPYLDQFYFVLQKDSGRINTLDGYYYLFSTSRNSGKISLLSAALNARNKEKMDSALALINKKIEFTETGKITSTDKKPIRYFIERINNTEKYLALKGWGFIDSIQNNKGDSIFITLNSGDKTYMTPVIIQSRPDVTSYCHKSNVDDAGFKVVAYFDNVRNGKYQLGVAIKNARGQWVYQLDERIITAGIPSGSTQ